MRVGKRGNFEAALSRETVAGSRDVLVGAFEINKMSAEGSS